MFKRWQAKRAAARVEAERRAALDRRIELLEAAYNDALIRYIEATRRYTDLVKETPCR